MASSAQDKLLLHWAFWTVLGTSSVVILNYLNLLPLWSEEIQSLFVGAPFHLPFDAPKLSPTANFLIEIVLCLLLVYNLLHISKRRQRLIIWTLSLLLVATLTPVLTLWGIYFNAVPYLISLSVAGLGSVYSPKSWIINQDTAETTIDTK